ncbi:hypothetical protein BJX68DRAFT_223688 [Aspergillus pseudodeflectus]|uniref:Uncharacterized protein n=1 Tax=Aspergillus pseudodeflectus TaxID=176178 RepID=A0ABR4LCC2_9EURO
MYLRARTLSRPRARSSEGVFLCPLLIEVPPYGIRILGPWLRCQSDIPNVVYLRASGCRWFFCSGVRIGGFAPSLLSTLVYIRKWVLRGVNVWYEGRW